VVAFARVINDFILLGKTIDDAPGEAFDKTARRLKLHNKSDASSISGGEAIERYAKTGNPEAFHFPMPMNRHRDCNWSFSGLKFVAQRHILWEERKYEIDGSDLIPSLNDLCASFQHSVVDHLCKKIHRGMIYADMRKLINPSNRKLIVSGGVACNKYIKRGIDLICKEKGYEMIVPPNELCTDNGVMIAWNGIEKWNAGIDIVPVEDLESIEAEPKVPFGTDVYEDIRKLDIKCKRIPLRQIFEENQIEEETKHVAEAK
jgi:N6-L-threonylcarbamoyladenine synthase